MMTNTLDPFRAAARSVGCSPESLADIVDLALGEDLAAGPDVTTLATVPAGQRATASLTPRQPGMLAGGELAVAVFEAVVARSADDGAEVRVIDALPDGSRLVPGAPAIVLEGTVRALLTAERTALNLLTHLSGIATATDHWVQAVAGTGARIRDSRKTLPGLRALQKYAVRCGGGVNHRMSLSDAALIKDNHVAAAGSVVAAIRAVRELRPDIDLEVEVDTLDQLDEALAAGAELVLLDNFSTEDTATAVARTRAGYPLVRLESSGGLTLDRAAEVARTGVDYLAVGGLTHSAPALDLGLDLS